MNLLTHSRQNVYRILALTITFLIIAVAAHAYQVITEPEATNEWLVGTVEAIFGALVIISGYLQGLIPGLNKVGNTPWRILAIAIALIILFVSFGWAQVVPLVITYLGSTNVYALIFKLFKKTPKPVE